MLYLHRLCHYIWLHLRADLHSEVDILYLGLLCALVIGPTFSLLMRYLIPSVSLPYFKSKHTSCFPVPLCAQALSIFLPNSLSPLSPSIYFLSVCELNQEIPPSGRAGPFSCLLYFLPFRTDQLLLLSVVVLDQPALLVPFCLSLWWDPAYLNKPRFARWKVKISTCLLLSGSLSPSWDCSRHCDQPSHV